MQSRKTRQTQKVAAAKAGFAERSAYNIENRGFIEAKSSHSWETRKDPFKSVWETEVILMLEASPNLQAKTILEELQRRHSGEYPNAMLRTLQRRVRK